MAKQKHYPRKLRQKLEKIAARRDESQEAQRAVVDEGPDRVGPFNTFYGSFLPRNSVTLPGAAIDKRHQCLTLQAHMRSPLHQERISIEAHWIKSETGKSL